MNKQHSASKGVKKREPSSTAGGDAGCCSHYGKLWSLLKKLKTKLSFDPATPLLGIYPKNPKTPIGEDICTPMFIAVLFAIAKIGKQPKCPSVVSG